MQFQVKSIEDKVDKLETTTKKKKTTDRGTTGTGRKEGEH